ncbi:MAG TPA: hypothetical protein VEZ14_10940, partial [Dehalococcoidia bacterium]|nr:hypothetical protein [Dehalococcoidia bacterium]
VRSGMTVLSRPNHPLRLAGLFGASLAFCAIVGAAVIAVIYMVRDQQGAYSSSVAGAVVEPRLSDLHLPAGLIAVHVVKDAGAFQQLAGWRPFVPADLPAGTKHDLSLAVSFPDDHGVRTGRVGYSPREDVNVGGITGPMVVIMEAKGTPGAGADGQLKRITTGNGRALAATLGCKGLVLDVQLYFGPPPAPSEPFITPYMTDVAQKFVDGVRRQCGG